MKTGVTLSIVSAVYNAEACVAELVRRITKEAERLTPHFEVILVEDGSSDKRWNRITECAKSNRHVFGIKLSRNFGQHNAITAGLSKASGEFVLVMDCDLQEDPKYMKALYDRAVAGVDIVLTSKERREHGWMKNFFSRAYCWLFNQLVQSERIKLHSEIGTYSILSRRVVDAFLKVKTPQSYYLNTLGWLGFEQEVITVQHSKRYAGTSSYTFGRLIALAINGIVSQSEALLYMTVKIGFAFFAFAILTSLYVVTNYLRHGYLAGWPSIIITILISTGLILVSLGIVGIYVGKCLENSKGLPHFIIQDLTTPFAFTSPIFPQSSPSVRGADKNNDIILAP